MTIPFKQFVHDTRTCISVSEAINAPYKMRQQIQQELIDNTLRGVEMNNYVMTVTGDIHCKHSNTYKSIVNLARVCDRTINSDFLTVNTTRVNWLSLPDNNYIFNN